MIESTKYDEFYKSDLKQEDLVEVTSMRWPRNRLEAIVSAGGVGERVLDIGCGNGLLLFQFRNAFKTLLGLEYPRQRLEQAKINLREHNFVLFDGGHLHYFTFRSLRRVLDKGGFRTVAKKGYGRFGFIQGVWPEGFSGGVQWVAEKR